MIDNYSKITYQLCRLVTLLFIITYLSACAENPVTGKLDLKLVSNDEEIAIGEKQYLKQRQLEQGDYIVSPELTEYVQKVGNTVASVSDRHLPYEFVIVNSSDFNAWALPGGKIGINRGLLVRLDCESELAAILAHEIVHAAASHGASNLSKQYLLGSARLASSLLIKDQDKLNITLNVLDLGGNLVLLKYSRNQELEADFYGMKYLQRAGFPPAGMFSVQKKMEQLSKNNDSNWLNIMFATHPPSEERVKEAHKFLTENNLQTKNSGCDQYKKAIQHLKKTNEAYQLYNQALLALTTNNLTQAQKLLNKAIAIEPKESIFYTLQAQLLQQNNNTQQALSLIEKAIALNPDYWQHYLIRGRLENSQGNFEKATSDFKQSLDLLPTGKAYFELGKLALNNNQNDVAIEYLWNAWNPETELGIKAGKMVARLDLEQNPQRYFDTEVYLDDNKNLIIAIYNNSELPVQVLEVELYKRKNWLTQKHYDTLTLNDQILSGNGIEVGTSIGPIKRSKLYKYTAKITKARLIDAQK